MAYSKTYWTNDSGATLDAINLNKIEQGIYNAHNGYNIKQWYEDNWDTNAFTDSEKAKLAGIDTTQTELDIDALQSDLTQAEIDISNLESDMTAVESVNTNQEITLLDHENRIAELETNVPFAPFYEYSIATPPDITSDTYAEVNRITTVPLPIGVYELGHTAITTYSTVTRSGYCRISFDGGSNWTEFNHELKDASDISVVTCQNPLEVTVADTVIDVIVQMRCEQTGDVFTVQRSSLILERKL